MNKIVIFTSVSHYCRENDTLYYSVKIKIYTAKEDKLLLTYFSSIYMQNRKRKEIALSMLEEAVGKKAKNNDLYQFAAENGYIMESDFHSMNLVVSIAEMIEFCNEKKLTTS